MAKILRNLSLPDTKCCRELSGNRILLAGDRFIKIVSLETYQELRDIPFEDKIWDLIVTPDERSIFLVISKGLHEYSFPEFNLVKVHEPKSNGLYLAYLKSKNTVLFLDDSRLLSLDVSTSSVTEFKDRHKSYITSLASTKDEEFVFTTGNDNTLKKWNTNSLELIKSIDLVSDGKSLLVNEDSGTLLVGMANGSLAEYSLHDLSDVRTTEVHRGWITKIVRLSSADVMTCSYDGSICLPFRDNLKTKVSNRPLYSITELSDQTIACCCINDGLKIISSPAKNHPLVRKSDPISSGMDSIASTLDAISSSLDSIRNSTSEKKPQLFYLLQHHLTQLFCPAKYQTEKLTGLTISVLPDLKSIKRSHSFEGQSEGRKKILTQKYALEMISSKSVVPDSEAILTLFDRKMKFQGKVTNVESPLVDFKVQKMSKGKWIFAIDQDFLLNDTSSHRPATAHFKNGQMNCLTSEGYPLTRSDFQATLKIDGLVKNITAIGNDEMVITSDNNFYRLNFETNTIEGPTNL